MVRHATTSMKNISLKDSKNNDLHLGDKVILVYPSNITFEVTITKSFIPSLVESELNPTINLILCPHMKGGKYYEKD